MPIDKNALGQRGENAVAALLLRPIQGDQRVPNEPFAVEIFGGKHELFDGIVYLKDHAGNLTGGHFFIQVKTSAPKRVASFCSARFTKSEVQTSIAFRAPVYLIGVEARVREECFVKGIPHTKKTGISRITKFRRNLSLPTVIKAIYKEVHAYHATFPSTFASGL